MSQVARLAGVGGARRWRGIASALALLGGCATTPPPTPEAPPAPPVEIEAPALLAIPRPADPPPPAPVAAPEPPPPIEPVAVPPSPLPAPPAAPPVTEEEQQALGLLADLQRLAAGSPEDLKRELAAVAQAVARGRSEAAKVKLAMLLSMANGGAVDEAKALGLLEQVMGKSPASTPTRQIAALLHMTLTERQREVREEQKKTDAVLQKLDALKAVERSLLERDRRPAGAPKASAPSSK